jgi:outer membrane biosynthesis protein TonB
MDIKYTIEILTKDIQDIEKLVGKLQNSKDASAIELDLAMSKLRNVYEILTLIQADRLNELVGETPDGKPEPEPEPPPESKPVPQPELQAEPEPQPESKPVPQPELQAEPEPQTWMQN